jgi:hypothetical protein
MRSLREQLAEARRLGIQVVLVRRTGEIRLVAPGEPTVTLNNRRKDVKASRSSLIGAC